MAKFAINDYLHPVRGNLFDDWRGELQKKERAKLDNKIDALSLHGLELIPGMAAPTGIALIFKLRVQGAVKLRPLFCEGPRDIGFTLLMGAKEIQSEWEPANAPTTAAGFRDDLVAHPERKRERIKA